MICCVSLTNIREYFWEFPILGIDLVFLEQSLDECFESSVSVCEVYAKKYISVCDERDAQSLD